MPNIEDLLKNLKHAVVVETDPNLGQAYDLAIMSAVKQLQFNIQKQHDEQVKLQAKREKAIADEAPQELLEHLDEMSGDCVDNQILLEQQMAVIAEMRLVYLYKSYEVLLKKILINAYQAETKQLFRWEQQQAFLNARQIDLKAIVGYKETDQLRKIVNNIKHCTEFNQQARRIPEFTNSYQVTFGQGMLFYKRVAPMVNKFIANISLRVFQSLYP